MVSHYLITRFNIRVSGFGPEKMNSPVMDLPWLENRMNLFKKFCAPSVLQQSQKNFIWLIYFDPDTPVTILDQLSFVQHGEVHTEFCFKKNYDLMIGDIIQKIRNAPTHFTITSRMDNDDIISKDFIQIVQDSFTPQHNTIININAGYEYSIQDGVLKKWNTRFKNQFISIIESKSSEMLLTIYGFPHWKPPQHSLIINIANRPAWMYIRHSLNYSDGAVKGIPVFIKNKNLKLFPFSVQNLNISYGHTLLYLLRWLPTVIRRRIKNLFSQPNGMLTLKRN